MNKPQFDRSKEDVGNIIALEHVNLTVPDQALATFFYVNGMGFTRDPYMDFGPFNVWINAGKQQFHLPTGKPQRLRGEIGVSVTNIRHLAQRLERIAPRLKNTAFNFKTLKTSLLVTCPWGNQLRCQESTAPGIPYIEFKAAAESLDGIAEFYERVMKSPVKRKSNVTEVNIGQHQVLRFRAATVVPEYDGHHIAIYTPDFSGPYEDLLKRGLVSEESDAHQYRFAKIIDPRTGKHLYSLEHEVRSLHHPMYARPLINRNPDQNFSSYHEGRDAFYPV